MKENDILPLLHRYLEFAQQLADELSSSFGVLDLTAAANSGLIPRSGACSSFGGGKYFFHGVGCRVEAAEIEIDFDFGPHGTLPGADPWKLFNFAYSHAEAYDWLPPREKFNQGIERLIERGFLYRVGVAPNPHLVAAS